MEALAEALSGCRVSWALGIGGEWFESDCEELDIPGDSVFYEELRGALKWFPSLKSVRLTGAALTREQQRELLELYPDKAPNTVANFVEPFPWAFSPSSAPWISPTAP